MKKNIKFIVGSGVIVIALGCLAWLGYGESKTYYHTIAELGTLQGSARSHRIRVGGTVEQGSDGLYGRTRGFCSRLAEGKALPVSYVGTDPLPDTFIDKSQALVEGSLTKEGSFVAERVQAKCASKYEAAPNGGPAGPSGAKPGSTTTSSM